MNEDALRTEWTLLHQELTVYTRKALWALRVALEPNDVLSECYLYCHSARHQVTDTLPLEAIAKNWIKQNIIWTNSTLRSGLGVSDAPTHRDTPVYDPISPEQCIHEWYKTLTPYEQGLWSIWHDKGIRKGKEVSGYLDISLSSAYLVLKECRELERRLQAHIKNTF